MIPQGKKNPLKSYQFSPLFFLIVLFQPFLVKSQSQFGANPYIEAIKLNDYSFFSQNNSLINSRKGAIYVANTNGAIVIEGRYKRLIRTPGEPHISIDKHDMVFAGGLNWFGYVGINKKNEEEVSNLLQPPFYDGQPPGQIENVVSSGNQVFFCTNQKLFLWNYKKISLIDSTGGYLRIFKAGDALYQYRDQIGLLKFQDGKMKLVPYGGFFIKKSVEKVYLFGKKLLVRTLTNNFYLCEKGKTPVIFKSPAIDFLKKDQSTSCVQLSNGNFAIGTQYSGIAIVNADGKLLKVIRRDDGLYDDGVKDLLVDRSGNLWALHNEGLSRVEYPSVFSYFGNQLLGKTKSVLRYEKLLYMATSTGLFAMNDSPVGLVGPKVSSIKGIEGDCKKLAVSNRHLYCATGKGLYEIKKGKAINTYKFNLKCFIQSSIQKNTFYLVSANSIVSLKDVNGKWTARKILGNIEYQADMITEDTNGTIWLKCSNGSILKVSLNNNGTRYVSPCLNANKLPNPIIPYQTMTGTVFFTSGGIYHYDYQNLRFVLDSPWGSSFLPEKSTCYPFYNDPSGKIWASIYSDEEAKEQLVTIIPGKKGERFKYSVLPLKGIRFTNIGCVYPEGNILWIGSSDGLVRFDSNIPLNKHSDFSTIILSVGSQAFSKLNPTHSVNGQSSGISGITEIPHKNNTVSFRFTSTSYESGKEVMYQYDLDGFDKEWSNWSYSDFKEYTNLPDGKYVFKVRSKNIFDEISEPAVFKLVILRPFYKRWWAFVIYSIFLGFTMILLLKLRYYRFAKEKVNLERIIHERTFELEKEKEKSERLLANVLPKDTADELKSTGRATTQKYSMVTVLFSDIEGFTKIAEHMNPEALIDQLDEFFFHFDSVVEKYNIEKIKTIGDAYMCAGGIPVRNRSNPVEVVLAALEMQLYMKELKQHKADIWDLRIGVHTGEVIAGVIGHKKLSYDIWGDAVNTASRMESSGEPGKVNISGHTFNLIKDFFICEYRGKMPVKYKGEVDMYFVKGIRPELSVDLKNIPNKKFHVQLQMLRLLDFEDHILLRLEKELPVSLYFHNFKHTMHLYTLVELLGKAEDLPDEDKLLLRTAALLYDTGFLTGYLNHEERSRETALEVMPTFFYNQEQIERVAALLLSTRPKVKPKNIPEKIIADALSDFVGRPDCVEILNNLFREQEIHGKVKSRKDWFEDQIKWIQKHEFYTETAKKLREINKEDQVALLQQYITALDNN